MSEDNKKFGFDEMNNNNESVNEKQPKPIEFGEDSIQSADVVLNESKEEVKAEEIKAEEIKAEEIKAEEVKAEEIKAEEIKAEEIKTEEIKEEIKAEEVKEEEIKAEEIKEEVKAEEIKEEIKEEEIKAEEEEIEEAQVEGETPRKEAYCRETVRKSGVRFKKVVAVVAIASLVGGSGIGASYSLFENFVIPQIKTASSDKNVSVGEDSGAIIQRTSADLVSSDSVSIIKNVSPSVVSINTSSIVTSNSYFSYGKQYQSSGAGSGVIFFEDDQHVYVATNEHVISGATAIEVSVDEQKKVKATVTGSDPSSDLAVISVLKSDLQAAGIEGYKVAVFGDSDTVQVGENVIAIGNALGYGKTSTSGIVSAVNKQVVVENTKYNVLQTDAAINPGNSGGALVNSKGEVIGINSVKIAVSGVEGMGYAIPSNVLTPIIEQLLTEGTVPRPYLGIVGTDVTEELGSLYKIPMGIVIKEIMPGGSADAAGIVAGDIITEFAGVKIMSMEKLVQVLAEQEVGSTVKARIIRDGETAIEVDVTLQNANAQ